MKIEADGCQAPAEAEGFEVGSREVSLEEQGVGLVDDRVPEIGLGGRAGATPPCSPGRGKHAGHLQAGI